MCFLHDYHNKWCRYLDWAEWCYNATQHSTTHPAPYEVVYRTPPLSISQYIPGTSNLEAIEYDLTTNRDRILQELNHKLSKAQFRNELAFTYKLSKSYYRLQFLTQLKNRLML